VPESSKGDFPVGKTIDPELSICSPGAHCAHYPPKALDILLGWILQSILIFYQSLHQKIQRLRDKIPVLVIRQKWFVMFQHYILVTNQQLYEVLNSFFLYAQNQTNDQLLIHNQYLILKCHKRYVTNKQIWTKINENMRIGGNFQKHIFSGLLIYCKVASIDS
jgi:hypothetical protein